ncbi:OLC1v1028195C1 [Oldenlandia corymbosa var. corymbosa]|uniref:Peroxidase n=1 Tax=Oldenlandia corymbosa var. corymbosa TaxID=529605 RepID=A0AAV1CCC8_OLDCO|nr:OLC1v1028195C1 [Oldenlandia corymbosa var. corymbosa]
MTIVTCIFLATLGLIFNPSSAQLSLDFYENSCTPLPDIVHDIMRATLNRNPRMGASILQLFFHDCFVNGCDASILLDDTDFFIGEKSTPPNKDSARGFELIDTIKSEVERFCPETVSCADILALAAREAVALLGGPFFEIGLGRRDSLVASFNSVAGQIPSPSFNLPQLIASFEAKGLDYRDLVILSGAHTIGRARCLRFRNHIYNDTNVDPDFADSVKVLCPINDNDDENLPLDFQTADLFDNLYYVNLINRRALLHSDQELYNYGTPVDRLVELYASDMDAFFGDFADSMVRMSSMNPLTGFRGEIRRDCRRVNFLG